MFEIEKTSCLAIVRRTACLVALSAVVLSASACSQGGESGDRKVASLPATQQGESAEESADDKTTAPEAERPHIRLDTSDEESEAIYQSWYKCFKDNGGVVRAVPVEKVRREGMIEGDKEEQPPATLRACATKEPVTPPELDRERNPEYLDDYRDWVKCINDKGLRVHALPNAEGWNYDDSVSQDERSSVRNQEIVDSCQLQAFK